MRLLAWSWFERKSKKTYRLHETYDCHHEGCFRGGLSDDSKRGNYRCGLPGFDRSKWGSKIVRLHHMGRSRVTDEKDPECGHPHPLETHEEGCPGSWYRSAFALSVIPYLRNLHQGGYSENLRLTRCTDRLVLDAVAYYERMQLSARRYFDEARMNQG